MATKNKAPINAVLERSKRTGKRAVAENQPPRSQVEAEAQIKSLIKRHKRSLDALSRL
jgi:hypothetical protein